MGLLGGGYRYGVVGGVRDVQQVVWVSSDRVLFVEERNVYSYSLRERSLKLIEERLPNQYVGVDEKGGIIKCSIEHFTIDSKDDFSTRFTLYPWKRDLLFFETVRPIYMDEEKIVAKTALDFLEEKFFVVDVEKGSIEEIEEPNIHSWELYVPRDIYFKKAYVLNEGLYFVEDIFGNLYLFEIPILRYIYNEIYVGTEDKANYEYYREYFKSFLFFYLSKILRKYDIDWNYYREYVSTL